MLIQPEIQEHKLFAALSRSISSSAVWPEDQNDKAVGVLCNVKVCLKVKVRGQRKEEIHFTKELMTKNTLVIYLMLHLLNC